MWGKTEVVPFSVHPSLIQVMIDKKQLEDVEYLNCLGCMKMMQDVHYTEDVYKNKTSEPENTLK